ncbi:MAG: 50S ribosomal protein L10 [Elusimicrobiota bacterium]|jgi:large subunit ribosomal protein L10
MPSTRKQREETVATLSRDFENIEGLVVAEYAGVKTPELNELRAKLKPVKGECRIVKNTLTKIALKNRGMDAFGEFFAGPSALVIQKGDALASTKVLVDFIKGHANLKLRAGYMHGRVLNPADLKALAALPSKPVLLGQFLARLQGPLYGLQGALTAPMRYLASALDQVAKKKEAAGPQAS